jgi:hypothetical protein
MRDGGGSLTRIGEEGQIKMLCEQAGKLISIPQSLNSLEYWERYLTEFLQSEAHFGQA